MKTTKNVLICEDDPVQLKILTTMIDQAGYRSLAARTPQEAVVAARRCGVDAVLADVQLQDGNAFDLMGDLRRMGLDAPVFMASAYATEGMRERARAAGASFFFEKPFNLSAIRNRVDEALKTAKKLETRVVLLESHPQLRVNLEKIATEAGVGVIAAEDGEKALELVRSGAGIDLLLMDLHGIGCPGGDLIRKALALKPTLHVVMMSGDASREDVRQAYEAGASSYIRKPISAEQFRHFLEVSLKAAHAARERMDEHRTRRDRRAAESLTRKSGRWLKSHLVAPSGSRKGERLWMTGICALALVIGGAFAAGYQSVSGMIAEVEEMSDRAARMSARGFAAAGSRQDAAVRQAQAAEQLLLMRESNDFTRRYYQDYLQEMQRQGFSQAAPAKPAQSSAVPPAFLKDYGTPIR